MTDTQTADTANKAEEIPGKASQERNLRFAIEAMRIEPAAFNYVRESFIGSENAMLARLQARLELQLPILKEVYGEEFTNDYAKNYRDNILGSYITKVPKAEPNASVQRLSNLSIDLIVVTEEFTTRTTSVLNKIPLHEYLKTIRGNAALSPEEKSRQIAEYKKSLMELVAPPAGEKPKEEAKEAGDKKDPTSKKLDEIKNALAQSGTVPNQTGAVTPTELNIPQLNNGAVKA